MPRYIAAILSMLLIFIGDVVAQGPDIVTPGTNELNQEIEGKLDLGDSYVEQTAVIMARDYPGEFSVNQVNAIYNSLVEGEGWNYYSDPSYKEFYKSASQSLQDGARVGTVGVGDCDDFAILMASLIESLGGSTRIVFAYDEESGQGHAYTELYLGNKDDPVIEDIKRWIENENGQPSVPGLAYSGEKMWLNLDYNATFIGGPLFDQNMPTVYRKIVWESGNKTYPKIIPLIDSMDNLSDWMVIKDDLGSNVSINLTPSKKGKAINISYNLAKGGWVGIAREVNPKNLAELKGINLTYLIIGGQNTLELELLDKDEASFRRSWILSEDVPRWGYLEAVYGDFKKIAQNNENIPSTSNNLDPIKLKKLKIIIRGNDTPRRGTILIDNIRGVMKIPKDSPWARAENQRQEKIALELAAKADQIREQRGDLLPLSVLLSVESMKRHYCLESYQALRHGLAVLPGLNTTLIYNGELKDIAFSPKGEFVATASYDNLVRVWSLRNRSEIKQMKIDDQLEAVIFSPDGKYMAIAGNLNGSIQIWDTTSWKEIASFIHPQGVDFITFSPNGKYLASAGARNNTALIWETTGWQNVAHVDHKDRIYSLAFSPDKALLATASKDGTAVLFKIKSNKEITNISHDNGVWEVAFSPDGIYLATTGGDYLTKIWDVASLREIARIRYRWGAGPMSFSPDGRYLATSDGTVVDVWDVSLWDGNETDYRTWPKLPIAIISDHEDLIRGVLFSSNGKYLATASLDNTVSVWDVPSWKEVARINHPKHEYAIDFSPNGELLAVASENDGETIGWQHMARIWDLDHSLEVARLNHSSGVCNVAFSSDGKLATADENAASVWDFGTGKELLHINSSNISSMSFSLDGKYIATADFYGLVKIWDTNTSREVARMLHGDQVNAMAFSPDGKYLATAGGALFKAFSEEDPLKSPRDLKNLFKSVGNAVRVWNTATWEETKYIAYDDKPVIALSFSPDGKLLASGGSDDAVRVWNTTSWDELASIHHSWAVNDIDFSLDGKYMATAAGIDTPRIWDTTRWKEVASLNHLQGANEVAFSPDTKYIATASLDRSVHIWNTTTWKEIGQIDHDYYINDIAFSLNGKYMAIASGDITNSGERTAIVFLWRPEDLISEACSRLSRKFTDDEWQQYLGNEPQRDTCECIDRKMIFER